MIYPDSKKEKAIHNYSNDLLKEMDIDSLTYTRGKPFSFPLLRALKYKTIHIQHEYNLLGWYGLPFFILLPLLRLLGRRLILTMHTVISPVDEKISTTRGIFYILANLIIGLTKSKVIVHSNAFKRILVTDYFFNWRNVEVIRHGVKEAPKGNRNIYRTLLGYKQTDKIALVIGTFHPDHQPHLVIQQADRMKNKVLVVFNSKKGGYKCQRYISRCKKYAYENNIDVKFKDIAGSNLWWEFFYAADVVVLPYIDGIGSGIFQDAMAARTPAVCMSTDYFRDILNGENCAELIHFNHDLPRAVADAIKNKNKLKKGCEKYAKKYSVKNMAKVTMETYK